MRLYQKKVNFTLNFYTNSEKAKILNDENKVQKVDETLEIRQHVIQYTEDNLDNVNDLPFDVNWNEKTIIKNPEVATTKGRKPSVRMKSVLEIISTHYQRNSEQNTNNLKTKRTTPLPISFAKKKVRLRFSS